MTAAYAPARDPIAKIQRRLTQWRAARPAVLRFDQPMLSITFDDFPQSAATHGAPILEAHKARGTFYASAGLAGVEAPCGVGFDAIDARRLAAAGHEIGCHTYGHRDCAKLDAYDALRDLAKNRDALKAMGLSAPAESLAYPYGETSSALKEALPARYSNARGILPGLNVGRADLAQLRAHALFGESWTERVHNTLRQAAARKALLIGFTHDVSDAPSPWGTSARDLDALLVSARDLGFAILPVREALARAQ